MTQTFGDLNLAAKTKEVISTIVRKEVDSLRPVPRYATVTSLDPVMVTYSGDPTPVPIKTGSIVPSAIGQIVRIEGAPGDRYISDVVGAEDGAEPYEPDSGNEFPEGVIIGEEPDQVVILPTAPDPVTGLEVVQGLEFENIYLIIEWDLIDNAATYDVEVAEKLGANTYDLTRFTRSTTNLARVDRLQPNTEYGIRVSAVSNIGLRSDPTAWYDFLTTSDNTIPPQVANPVLSRGATSLIVNFEALTALEAPDVANGNGIYEVQIDTEDTFDTPDIRSYLGTSSIVAFTDLTFEATWYARIRAIDTSGNLGVWSNVVSLVAGAITSAHIKSGAITEVKLADDAVTGSKIFDGSITETKIGPNAVTTGKINAGAVETDKLAANAVTAIKIDASAITTDKLDANAVTALKIAANAVEATHIAAGQINSDKIVVDGLDAAVIKFGTMSGDRITANSLTVDRLTSSTLTATTITLGAGGQFKIGNPTTNGILINDNGIVAYNGGVLKFFVDSNGNATFAGNISAGVSISSPEIVGGSLSGALITGTVFQTAYTGARVVIDQSNLEAVKFYDSAGSLIGTVGWKSGGYGSGLYIGSPGQVVVSNLSGTIGSGSFSSYSISSNTFQAETATIITGLNSTGYLRRNGVDVSVDGHVHGYYGFGDAATLGSLTVYGSTVLGNTTTMNSQIFVPGMAVTSAAGNSVRRFASYPNELFAFDSTRANKTLIRRSNSVPDEYARKLLVTELPTWNALTTRQGIKRVEARGPMDRGSHVDRVGPIAEEMAETFPEAVLFNDDGKPVGWDEPLVITSLWRAMQLLTKELETRGMLPAELLQQ